MSRRKRYRRLRNKAIKDNLKLFSQNRQRHREEREQAESKEQLGRVRLIYEEYKAMILEESKKHPQGISAPQVIAATEAFKEAVAKKVKNAHTRKVVLDEINFAELKFLAAYGPKTDAEKAAWRAEAKALRVSNRKQAAEDEADPSRN